MFRLPRMKTFLFLFQGVASRFHFIRNILWAPILRHKHTAEVIHMSCGHEIELGNTRSPPKPPCRCHSSCTLATGSGYLTVRRSTPTQSV